VGRAGFCLDTGDARSAGGVRPRRSQTRRDGDAAARTLDRFLPGAATLEQAGVAPGLQAQALSDSEEPARRLRGTRLKRFLANVDRLTSIAVITADDVVRENRVTLSTTLTPDAHGPLARVELRRPTARTLANRDFLAARAAEILRAAGAREVVRMNWAPVLLHIHSTMRMGAVVNAEGESFAVERLFVADNSALPNALGGPNPTLTTQAVATRTAERIFVRYFGGDPWGRARVTGVVGGRHGDCGCSRCWAELDRREVVAHRPDQGGCVLHSLRVGLPAHEAPAALFEPEAGAKLLEPARHLTRPPPVCERTHGVLPAALTIFRSKRHCEACVVAPIAVSGRQVMRPELSGLDLCGVHRLPP
jgi:hypothetical protein